MTDEPTEAHFRALVTSLPELVFGCRGTGERTWPSPQWVIYTGVSEARSIGFGWLEAIHPDDRETTMQAWATAPASGELLVEHRIRHAPDGAYRWHQTRAAIVRTASAGGDEWVGSSIDVDDMRRLRDRSMAAEQQLRTLVEGVPQLLWRSCDLGLWTWACPQWLDHTGQTQEQTHGHGWLDAVHPADRETAMAAWEAARPHGRLDVEFRLRRVSDGAFPWHRTRSMPVRDASGRIVEWLGSTTDVQDLKEAQQRQQELLAELREHARDLEVENRERRRIEAQLLHDALHDDLTQLRNRAFLTGRLRLALAGRPACRCSVLFMDLDRFKLVNDSLGHETGDLLLIEVARRLQTCIGPRDTLARFGGDEFALLIEEAGDAGGLIQEGAGAGGSVEEAGGAGGSVEEAGGAGGAMSVVERIIHAMRRPMWLAQQEIFTSCSIGVVHATEQHRLPEDMLRDADIAMYHAKRYGNLGFAVFTPAMHSSAVEALELRTDLRNAASRGEFHLHYQPICDAAGGAIMGVEALIRWQHPRRGLVPPAGFIGIAEEAGLIGEIGRWVLRQACAQMQAWRERLPDLDLCLNVNVSGEELINPDFSSSLREILDATGMDPRRLQLEITESIFLRQPDLVGAILDGIRRLGVRIALDDFGTGYSSLSYLDRYRVDTIKLDRSFVGRLPARAGTAAIVDAIVRLGQAMGLDVVAEGVETPAQLQALQAAGCALVQGYLLGRPAPAADIAIALAQPPGSRGA